MLVMQIDVQFFSSPEAAYPFILKFRGHFHASFFEKQRQKGKIIVRSVEHDAPLKTCTTDLLNDVERSSSGAS